MGKSRKIERLRRYKAKLKRNKGLSSCKHRLRVRMMKLTDVFEENKKRKKDDISVELSAKQTRFVVEVHANKYVCILCKYNAARANHYIGAR